MAKKRTLVLQKSAVAKNAITDKVLADISALYVAWAKEIGEKAASYERAKNRSAPVSARQYRILEKMLIEKSEETAAQVGVLLKKSQSAIGEAVRKENAELLKMLGVPADDAAYLTTVAIQKDVIERIISGQVYASEATVGGRGYAKKWSLAKAIWSDKQSTQKQIYQIIAGAQAKNEPIYKTAKSLEQYVNPRKRKPWNLTMVDGRRIYPKQVDYASQRLARTLSQHTYQQSCYYAWEKNEYIDGYIWVANGSRACPFCLAMNGKWFPKDNWQLDHPNGMCVLRPSVVKDVDAKMVEKWNSLVPPDDWEG